MGLLDRLLGRQQRGAAHPVGGAAQTEHPQVSRGDSAGPQDSTTGASAQDQAAIARYRYLLRTAPPERIEQVHEEAFARLTPQQRQAVLAEMTRTLPAGEAPGSEDPAALARAATRAEMAQPGYLQRTFGRPGMGMGGRGMGGMGGRGMGMGMGMGGMFAGSMLGTVAGVVVGSAVADLLLGGFDQSPEAADLAAGADGADYANEAGTDPGADAGGDPGVDPGADSGQDYAAFDDGGSAGWNDTGGDFGGGDFGGDLF